MLAAAALSAAAALLFRAAGPHGLWLDVTPTGRPSETRAVAALDIRDVNVEPGWSSGPLVALWRGTWLVEQAGEHRLVVEGDGPVQVAVDGHTVLAVPDGRARTTVPLAAGPHALAIEYRSAAAPRLLRVYWAPPGGRRRAFDAGAVLRAIPTAGQEARGRWSARLAAAALVLCIGAPLALGALALARRWRTGEWPPEARATGAALRRPRARRALRLALPALVVLYGGALRFEALVGRYGWQGPRWAVSLARGLETLHGDALRWDPSTEAYDGDPLTYLRRARAMTGFYDADVREPLFPFTTRLLLGPLHDRPLAVNAASAVFSTLCVLATYLLGAAAFGPGVGLGAALVLALDRDALWWGVEGFRDDAYAMAVALSAWLLLRLRERPSARAGVLAGLAAGAACLTRITAFSFILPALAVAAFERGAGAPARRRALAVLLVTALLVAGPYLLTCALAYGDPFYAVNFHTKFYRSRVGMAYDTALSWSGFLRQGFTPGELLQTGLRGLTTYPFANKWVGLDHLTPWLRRLLAPLAAAGLVLFVGSARGRVLLAVLLGALLPYAFTWRVPGGAEWRFTLCAYPFYLVAAFAAVQAAVRRLRGPGPGAA